MIYAAQLFTFIGILAGVATAKLLKMPAQKKSDYALICGGFGLIIGAKIPVLMTYGYSPAMILSGRSYMGGLIGAFIALNLYKWGTRQTQSSFGGRFIIPIAVAAGFGKIGCYFTGCCNGVFFMPPQLFESGFEFLTAGLLYVFYRLTQRADLLFPIYLSVYLVMRFFIEFYRNEPRIWGDFTIYQILAILFLPITLAIIYHRTQSLIKNKEVKLNG